MGETHRGYAPVNGLRMYYEVHGSGAPLVLLHSAFMMVEGWGELLPAFAKSRQVIAVEQQAHGRTADIDRPLTFEQMADDTAALLRHIGVTEADVFGYSDGGNVGLALAMRHPGLLRRLAVAGTNYTNEGLRPEVLEFLTGPPPDPGEEWVAGMRQEYESVAPNPRDFGVLLQKVSRQAAEFRGWSPDEVRGITAPTLMIAGDDDIIRPEHAVEMSSLHRHGRLAVLPCTGHIALLARVAWLTSMITEFFEAPVEPEPDNDLARPGNTPCKRRP